MNLRRWRGGAILLGLGMAAMIAIRVAAPTRSGGDGGEEGAVEPRVPHFSAESVREIAAPVEEQIAAGAFPGAALVIGYGGEEAYALGLGAIGWRSDAPRVDPETTLYDLASMTKVVATASAVVLLADEGRLDLDEPVGRVLTEFREGAKAKVTFRHLLTHTSGLPAGAELRGANRRDRIARALSFSIYPPPGARAEYSDIGYLVLWEAAERVAGEPLTAYLERKLFGPLGMKSTRFVPGLGCEPCAPTGRLRDQTLYRGMPFDPLAQRLDGVSGHAGLFSSAADLGRFAAMIMNGGILNGVRVLSPEMVSEFVGLQPYGNRFRLGWEAFCEDPDPVGLGCDAPRAIGHTGWTGTSLWIDPESSVWIVLLTNRTYEPRAPNEIQKLRRELFARATGTPWEAAGAKSIP